MIDPTLPGLAKPAEAAELMRRAQEGSLEAFTRLVEAFQGDLYRFFRVLGADRHSAEDLAQESFVRLYRFRSRYRPLVPLRVFLYTLARNVWRDCLRKARRRPELLMAGGEGWDAGTMEKLLTVDLSEIAAGRLDLREALARLPERSRLVLILSAYQGLAYPEISVVLGIPLGTVKTRMFHALRRLREDLKSYAHDR